MFKIKQVSGTPNRMLLLDGWERRINKRLSPSVFAMVSVVAFCAYVAGAGMVEGVRSPLNLLDHCP